MMKKAQDGGHHAPFVVLNSQTQKIRELLSCTEVLDYLLSQTRKPTDIAVSASAFLSDSIEIVEIPVHLEKRKRFMSIC